MDLPLIILVRHAHREVIAGHSDNGLSKRGQTQADLIANYFVQSFQNQKPLLFSSPKQRCLETLKPLANKTHTSISIEKALDEASDESELKFEERIESFHQKLLKEKSPLRVLCSHGDWIPFFCELALGERIELQKGGWAQLSLEQGKLKLEKLIQDFGAR